MYKYARFADYRQAVNKATQKGGTDRTALPSFRALFPSAEYLGQGWGAMNAWVLAGYRPGTYPGKMTFFWVEEEVADFQKWRKVTAAAKAIDSQVIRRGHTWAAFSSICRPWQSSSSQRLNQVQAEEQSEPV